MYSYPNLLPLSAATVERIAEILKSWRIDRVYGFNAGRQNDENGGAAIAHSARRYIDSVTARR